MTMDKPQTADWYISPEAIGLANTWLQECETRSSHSICKKRVTLSEFTLPRRLLDIGELGSKTPFLVETSALPDKDCRHATLSHRWGDPEKLLQTTVSNIHEHYKLVSWSKLPKTFRDAITVTQHLGLRYLWIDSLCIIQKNRVDFEAECSTMHLVYLHCHCMIVASDAAHAAEGFLQFWEQRLAKDSPIPRRVAVESEQLSEFRPSRNFRFNDVIRWQEWREELNGSLSTRAWTLQELELAPRNLHFTKRWLTWECRARIGAGDASMLQLRRSTWGVGDRRYAYERQSIVFRLLDQDASQLTPPELMWKWLNLAEEYSGKALSHEHDKLPAISALAAVTSALAREPSGSGPPTFLAGIWLMDLPRQLFWCPIRPGHEAATLKRGDAKVNILPSWSWASSKVDVTFQLCLERLAHADIHSRFIRTLKLADIYVFYKLFDCHPEFKYISTDIVPDGANPFGGMTGCTLRIRGAFTDLDVSNAKLTDENRSNTYSTVRKSVRGE